MFSPCYAHEIITYVITFEEIAANDIFGGRLSLRGWWLPWAPSTYCYKLSQYVYLTETYCPRVDL